jgi:hypothetical protein
LSPTMITLMLMFRLFKNSCLAQLEIILPFLNCTLSRVNVPLLGGLFWPNHLGSWGIKSLLLHSSGTVLWNGLHGSRFLAPPLYADFLRCIRPQSLSKGLINKLGPVTPNLFIIRSKKNSVGCKHGKTGRKWATIQLQLIETFLQASYFPGVFFCWSRWGFFLDNLADNLAGGEMELRSCDIADLGPAGVIGAVSAMPVKTSGHFSFSVFLPENVFLFLFFLPVAGFSVWWFFLLFRLLCCIFLLIGISSNSVLFVYFSDNKNSRQMTMDSNSKFTASADSQARYKSQLCVFGRYIEVLSITPTMVFAVALLARLATAEFQITTRSIDEFLAAVGNRDIIDWGRAGSTANSKIWVFELVRPVPFVVNEQYAETTFTNYGDTVFYAFHLDFFVTLETREQGLKVTREKAVTVQPIGENFSEKEGQLCARLIRIDDNGRQSPSDLIAAAKGAILAALIGTDLGAHSDQVDIRWSKVYESKTEAALLKEAARRDKKAAVAAKCKGGKGKPKDPPDVRDIFDVVASQVVLISLAADGLQREQLQRAINQALSGSIRGSRLGNELKFSGYSCIAQTSDSLGRALHHDPLPCLPYAVLAETQDSSLMHLLSFARNGCNIPMVDIEGVVYTTRPNDAKHRRKNNPGHFPMIIFKNRIVLAHFMAVYQQSKAWKGQFLKSPMSCVLCTQSAHASVTPSLLPVDPQVVIDLSSSNKEIQTPLRDNGGDTFLASLLQGVWSMEGPLTDAKPSSGKGSDPAEERRLRREANAAKAAQSAEDRMQQGERARPAEPNEDRQRHMKVTMEELAASNPQAALNFMYEAIRDLLIEEEALTLQTLGGLLPRRDDDTEGVAAMTG